MRTMDEQCRQRNIRKRRERNINCHRGRERVNKGGDVERETICTFQLPCSLFVSDTPTLLLRSIYMLYTYNVRIYMLDIYFFPMPNLGFFLSFC